MSRYRPVFEDRFVRNQQRHHSLQKHIQRHVDQILDDPYTGTERLGRIPGKQHLRGWSSIRVTRSFRIIFVVCEECRRAPACRFCFCEGLPDKTVVFLTVGPHERAYAIREELVEYETPQGGE